MVVFVARWRELLSAVTPIAVLGALICCALPIALVTLGAGSVVATMVTTAPWLPVLSRHKEWVFVLSVLLLGANYWALYRARGAACEPGGICHPAHPVGRWLRRVFWASLGLFAVAIAAAYLALPVAVLVGY